MTQPEQPVNQASSGDNVTVTHWNNVVATTRFPEYIYNATAYTYGGNLNAYRRTWAGYNLGSIDAYGSRYTEFRDIRSTFMTDTVSSGAGPTTNTWATAVGYTLSNSYNSANQEGRLTLDPTNGIITPNVNSTYIFWAGITIPNTTNMTAAFLQIETGGVTIAEVNQNLDLIASQSLTLRNQTFVAYKNTDHTIQYKLLYTGGTSPAHTIIFGYTELIGEKSGCGAYSIL